MNRSIALLMVPLTLAAPSAAQQAAPADSARVYELHEVEALPRATNAADFAAALDRGYPPHLRHAGVSGTVQVAFVLGSDGTPREIQAVSASDSGFVAPSVAAVALLRFSPAQLGGRAVPVRVVQPITWSAPPPADSVFVGAGVAEAAPAGPDTTGTYLLRDVDVIPRLRNADAFRRELVRLYPVHLRDTGTSGTVQVRFRIGEDGTVSHPSVAHSTHPGFIPVTLQVVQTMRYWPARRRGRRVAVWVEQPIVWMVMPGPGPSFGTPLGQPGARPVP